MILAKKLVNTKSQEQYIGYIIWGYTDSPSAVDVIVFVSDVMHINE